MRGARWAVFALLAAPSLASAQTRVRGRVELGAALVPWKRWEFQVSERALFGDAIDGYGRWQTLAGADYSVNRYLSFGAGYRLSAEGAYGGPLVSHRALVQAVGTLPLRRFRLGYRLRYQGVFSRDGAQLDYSPALRNRVQLRWRPRVPFEASASAELFSDVSGTWHAFDRLRVEAAVGTRIRSVHLGLGYRYDASLLEVGHPYHMAMVSVFWHWERHGDGRGHARDGDEQTP